jgi:CheY-like chemotaxis protein
MEGKKVLAAEDDAFAMKMFTTILTALGQSVDPASDGKEAVTKY